MKPSKIGRYLVLEEIARGGMATVYRAQDPLFERDVAVKILPSEFLHDPKFRLQNGVQELVPLQPFCPASRT